MVSLLWSYGALNAHLPIGVLFSDTTSAISCFVCVCVRVCACVIVCAGVCVCVDCVCGVCVQWSFVGRKQRRYNNTRHSKW
jgi:hypothetical protein